MNVSPIMTTMERENAREISRKMAIYSGDHKFITLKLLNRKFQIVSGIELVNALPYYDEQDGFDKYQLEVVGGEVRFAFSPQKNAFVYDMLDSVHNREFLASHYANEIWRIEDGETRKEVKKRAREMAKELLKDEPAAPKRSHKKKKEPADTSDTLVKSGIVNVQPTTTRVGVKAP